MKRLRIKQNKISPELLWLWSWLPANGDWFCAGGAVRSIMDKSPVCDIDLFPMREGADTEALFARLRFAGCRLFFACPEGLLYSYKHRSGLKIQVIKAICGNPNEVIASFDFTAAQFAMVSAVEIGVLDRKCLWDAARRRLVSAAVTYPNATLRRAFKYQSKGYKMTDAAMADLVRKCAAVPYDEEVPPAENVWRRYID